MDEDGTGRKVDRRRLLRKAGVVAVTVAGAGAAGAALAPPALAAAGDPITAGGNVNAGTTTTRISNSGLTAPTVALANGAVSGPTGAQQAGPSLRLEPSGDYVLGSKGSMGVDNDGTLWLSNSDAVTGAFADPVRTGYNSTSLLSFPPVRILETRPQYAGGKAAILNPGVVDGNGFVGAGQTLNLSLDSLLVWGYTVFANITVVAGNQAGYLIAYPAGTPRPNASNVNYTPGLVIPNSAVISVGAISGATNAISIYVGGGPTAIIIDISAAVVNFSTDIKPQSGLVGAQATEAPARVRPASLYPKL
jgi:hypothetical protein